MQQLYQDVTRAARVNVPVLILGETGVGKEHVARAVHSESPRIEAPFVVINCAAIPPALLESTLFGHERGSFTGANARSIGVFERAHQGVLFLDEIGELTLGAQAALLRAIETRRICRVGSSVEVPVDVRIVAATHCDLKAMVEDGAFRRDLYFRLSGVELLVPPLRERTDEIEPLTQLFLSRAREEWGIGTRQVTPEALRVLSCYSWPGNVRQLRHAVERSALLGASDVLRVEDLPDYLVESERVPALAPRGSDPAPPLDLSLRQQMQRYERVLIDEALRRAGGNRQAAAKLLRVPLRTLFRKLRATGPEDDKD
jgi:DNA-binding NtrC family response regulator